MNRVARITSSPPFEKLLLQFGAQLCSSMEAVSYIATCGGLVNGTSWPFTWAKNSASKTVGGRRLAGLSKFFLQILNYSAIRIDKIK